MLQQDEQLLSFINQNAQMGTETITQLIKITDDIPFRRALETQLTEYQNIVDSAQSLSQKKGVTASDIPGYAKMSSSLMLKINTMKDKTPSNMARMMIQGSTMGVVEITKHRKELPLTDPQTQALAEKLVQTEQKNIKKKKKYL